MSHPTVADRSERCARAWQVLREVLDPEVPVVSICDLGIVRAVHAQEAGVEVVVTPTYSGCPATEAIADNIGSALNAAGLGPVRITLQRAPAWTTDWISEDGRRKLREYGIAPPSGAAPADAAHRGAPLRFMPRRETVACPRCGSLHTERLSAFGATACKALYRCVACREPFEYFKPL